MREIRYLDEARAELGAAVLWLEAQRSSEVAARFLDEIEAAISQIAELPHAWPVSKLDPNVHVRQLRRIRYAILYVLTAEALTVVAVAHTSRRPGYWLDRVRRG